MYSLVTHFSSRVLIDGVVVGESVEPLQSAKLSEQSACLIALKRLRQVCFTLSVGVVCIGF